MYKSGFLHSPFASLAMLHVLESTGKLEATAQSISGNPLNILMANKSVFRNEFMMIQDKYLLEFQDLKFILNQPRQKHNILMKI